MTFFVDKLRNHKEVIFVLRLLQFVVAICHHIWEDTERLFAAKECHRSVGQRSHLFERNHEIIWPLCLLLLAAAAAAAAAATFPQDNIYVCLNMTTYVTLHYNITYSVTTKKLYYIILRHGFLTLFILQLLPNINMISFGSQI